VSLNLFDEFVNASLKSRMDCKIAITCKELCTAKRKASLDVVSLVALMAAYRDMQNRARKMLDTPFEGILRNDCD
jgi:hypothetical protein